MSEDRDRRDDRDGWDEETRPLGWDQPEVPRGWDAPDARPQSWDSPAASPRPAEPPPYPTQAMPSAPPPYPPPPYRSAPYPAPYQAPSYPPPAWGTAPPHAGGWVPYGAPVAEHPRSTLALVLGIIGLVAGLSTGVGFLLSPVAWAVGRSAVREIAASGGHYGGQGQARAGQVLGIIGTVLLAILVALLVLLVVFLVATHQAATPDYGNV